jgi:predicted aconitase with swiveling domain
MRRLKGEGVTGGRAEGEAVVTTEGVAFNLGVDMASGTVVERGHELEGRSPAGKVLVCRTAKGSGGGPFGLYQLVMEGRGPVAIVATQANALLASGCALAEIPLVHRLEVDPTRSLRDGARLRVDGDAGEVEEAAP